MGRRNYKIHELEAFLGGIDLDSAPFDTHKDCLISCSNVLPSTSIGGITVRNGKAKHNSSIIQEGGISKAVVGLDSFYNQGIEYFLAQAGTKLLYNSPEGIMSDITGSLSFTDSVNNLTSMEILGSKIFGVNRLRDQMWEWSLTGNATKVTFVGLTVFTGAGLDDATSGGSETDTTVHTYTIIIDATGTPDTFKWKIDSGSFTTGVAITGSAQTLANGVTITFAATTGHTLNDQWTINTYFPPSCQGIVSFQRRLFTVGDASNPLLSKFSAIDDGEDFSGVTDVLPGLNFLNFDEGQGSKLVGAIRRGTGSLLFFKEKSIHLVEATGTQPPFVKYLFVDGIGLVSHQSIVTLPGGMIMFWDTDDAYIISGNQINSATVHPKTKRPRLRNFFRNEVNQSRLQYVVGVYYPLLDIVRFFYSTPGSNTNNAHIDYHVKTRSWWKGNLRGTSACTRIINGQIRLYAGDTNGFIYRQDYNTNDDGSAIDWNAQLPWQVFEGFTIRKKFDLFYAQIDKESNYDVLADIYFDNNQTAEIVDGVLSTTTLSGATWDTALFDTDSFPAENNVLEASLSVKRLFKSVSVDIHGSNLDQPVDIHKVAFIERPLEFTRLTT